MIRIQSNLDSDLKVPYPTPRGVKPKFFTIPKRNADGTPGVTELSELDNITIERLRWHHERRPVDVKDKGNEAAPHHEIGLLKIEIVDGTPSPTKRTDVEAPAPMHSASDLEPPRRAAPAANKAPAPKPGKAPKPPKPRKAAA